MAIGDTFPIPTRHAKRLRELAEPFVVPFSMDLAGSKVSPNFPNGTSFATVLGAQAATWGPGAQKMQGHYCALGVTGLTGSGDITITGNSVDVDTGVVTIADTEDIEVTAGGYYVTRNRWYLITDITIPVGITVITYDVIAASWHVCTDTNADIVAYRITGYKIAAHHTGTPSLQFRLLGIKRTGANSINLSTLEKFTVTSLALVDSLRGTRDYASAVLSELGFPFRFGIDDFDTYFVTDENVFQEGTYNDGFIIEITHSDIDDIAGEIRCIIIE